MDARLYVKLRSDLFVLRLSLLFAIGLAEMDWSLLKSSVMTEMRLAAMAVVLHAKLKRIHFARLI